ncbi:hypothetical protein [Corallococcus terminator]|uniref:Uncharacterized protein n=1 Tax=Corallococcus terminator TaxID=2316733 RepID=A0A3A8JPZ7_9BACT|nr:hypothetical protein [Corallococcus terminator]RKG93850.1 hypothetical protein D7V88_00750 [Corallococcus terminator]
MGHFERIGGSEALLRVQAGAEDPRGPQTGADNAVHAEEAARAVASAMKSLAAFVGARELRFQDPVPKAWRRALVTGA